MALCKGGNFETAFLLLAIYYANRSNAERAANAQWKRLKFSLQLGEGWADLYTGMQVKKSGLKQPIDEA